MTIAMISKEDQQDGPPNTPPHKVSDDDAALDQGGEPDFPHAELARLDEMIHRQRWVVPVLPKCELELLLEASIHLCEKGLDTRSEACQRFFREGLTTSFTKILTDDAVTSWKMEIQLLKRNNINYLDFQKCIMKNCEKLIELIVAKLQQDWFPLLELLSMVFNPTNKFHVFNSTRLAEPVGQQEELIFAKSTEGRPPKGWLVDLINHFGKLGGFDGLLDRFQSGKALSVPLVCAILKPFGMSYELLTVPTIEKYFLPIIDIVPSFLENLTDEELKKEAKNEAKNDALSTIIKTIKCLVSRLPSQDETSKNLEIFRLKMILRLLQISSFNGKMNALNEVNKVIGNVSYPPHRQDSIQEDEWLTAERMAAWIKDNKVLQIVLRDSLHQPQYVEKLEKIIRFVIKQNALSLEDLDDIWAAQHGKHEAIVKNVHDLLAKLAWDFSPEQLDHLFICFQTSWSQATKKQREKLLELIRRLAEDDKDGVMAHKVLSLLWSLAHSEDVPTDIMDQALSAHVKILDYSCSHDRDIQKQEWLDRCVQELKSDKWVIPALKQIKEICCSYSEAPPNVPQQPQRPAPHASFRHSVLNRLQNEHSLVILVSNNLMAYMHKVKRMVQENPQLHYTQIKPDGRYPHVTQVQERLSFLRFLLKDGQLWLCAPQAKQIWTCLAEHAVFLVDREACFKWFSKLMGEEPDLDPEINTDFFEKNILQLDPALLTEQGMRCLERFFRAVNMKDNKLVLKRRTYLMQSEDLIGIDYIWRVVLCGNDDVAEKAIDLLKETFTNLGPRLQSNHVALHEDFISNCRSRLTAMYDTVSIIECDKDSVNKVRQETTRMCRVLKVLYEYIDECDNDFGDERTILPLVRSYRGKHICIVIRFLIQGRQPDEIELWPHTNDTLGTLRRKVLQPLKSSPTPAKIELYQNSELLDPMDDKKLIADMPFRDKTVLTAKFIQTGNNMASSPDSSSDSSGGSPPHHYDGPSLAAESCLPGVIMSTQPGCSEFLLRLADLGCSLKLPQLRDGARILLNIMPADTSTVRHLESMCQEATSKGSDVGIYTKLEDCFFSASPSTVLYNLQILYSLLMPGGDPTGEKSLHFQYTFMMAGGVKLVINMLTKNNFLSTADVATKRSAFLFIMKIAKLVFTTVGYTVINKMTNNMPSPDLEESPSLCANGRDTSVPMTFINVLQQALISIPSPTSDCMVRSVASRLAQALYDNVTTTTYIWTQFMTGIAPDMCLIRAILKILWAAALGAFQLCSTSLDEIEKCSEKAVNNGADEEDRQVCNGGLEALAVVLALHPAALDVLSTEPQFHKMILNLVLSNEQRSIRCTAMEQVLLIATKCSPTPHTLVLFIVMLFKVLNKPHQTFSKEYFQLLCGLLNSASLSKISLPGVDRLLVTEIDWLKNVKLQVSEGGCDMAVSDVLLEGHLAVTRELVALLPPEKKYEIGGDSNGICLIRELIEDFVFPFSKVYLQLEQIGVMPAEQAIPVCSTQFAVIAAYDLLVTLCTGCVQNLQLLRDLLTNMYYSANEEPITEWEYLPPVGPRPNRGFVGLKNAGATCYMNSVLQQLYMIRKVREGVLSIKGATSDIDEDFSGEDRPEQEPNIEPVDENLNASNEGSRKEYHIGVLKQIQAIFGHLACSKLQYYVPRGLWRHFKLQGEPVNLREQHDACEFYNILVEDINEAMKALGEPQILTKVLGGSFSDQKICKTCPHRYSREEAFTVISIDIRFYSNLYDSLEQYVKGDLLEGDNAYLCEKCNKKVDTVKRICLKKLPSTLAIQLKRFDYDWERECSIKFNDYFEFPRQLDMEPYTVTGLARNGELIDCDDEDMKNQSCSKYKLSGIVVHSGQASGGHYYSYILHRVKNESKWYKFDDGEVSQCKMDDDEEMKNQCFGGEYMGEQVFDNIMKRVSYRRQKRWWNAYLLFYTRLDQEDDELIDQFNELSLADRPGLVKMPAAIERSIVRQNVRFMHCRSQFSSEYFQFMKKLIMANHSFVVQAPKEQASEAEEVAIISTTLASKFLFFVALHTKKTLRGPASEWYDALHVHLRVSAASRAWFAREVLFSQQDRFLEYLLECPSPEVRLVFAKLIVLIAASSRDDPPQRVICGPLKNIDTADGCSLSDQLLFGVLLLLNKEVAEHGRHVQQYFHLFQMYATIGRQEKIQLLKLNVVETFMLVAVDDGPGPTIKYQHSDLSKLYQVVSLLIRCCDVSSKCGSSIAKTTPLPNPHGETGQPLMTIQANVAENLFGKQTYVKKVIEDANNSEDTIKLLKFCCWENPSFSSTVLSELLWQIGYTYTSELRPFFDLLLHMLLLQDSWQEHRIHNALCEDREGLFETTARTKSHHQKRAYQCIKCMVSLFTNCAAARRILNTHKAFKQKFNAATSWLAEELEKRQSYPNTNQQFYNNWSSPAQSNEISNGFFLERSASARSTLEKAYELCPEESDECEESESNVPEEIDSVNQSAQPNISCPTADVVSPTANQRSVTSELDSPVRDDPFQPD